MRVLAIGLGGAGSRIVDVLHDHDRRSKVCCMSAVVIDIDPNSLTQLRYLPKSAKIFFPPVEPGGITDIIDIGEVMTRIQSLDTMEIDAILLCCGLGGSVVDIAPLIIDEIRKSYMEPIFALTILPCLDEGKRVSARAADDLDMLQELADAVVLFDNETWSGKIKTAAMTEEKRVHKNRPSHGLSPRDHYNMLNERIARQAGLLLRAGEFSERGIEVGEVVLDAGEVLNTLKGMGFVAVGYAVERLPTGWLDLIYRRRSAKYFIEGSHERAARIVSLAKKAVYEEISVPCDLTSADKALVLIAGPSAELSMKGFQTVRKWIDRSIAGLEMRSGDYPVKNTSFVGIIIMLSGLSNIPRVEEIRKIRTEYQLELEGERLRAEEGETGVSPGTEGEDIPYSAPPLESEFLEGRDMAEPSTTEKDEMIELSGIGRGGQKKRDDTIEIFPKYENKEDNCAINLPQKQRGREIDIAGSTSVTHSVPAPKNSVFSPKGISLEKTAPKDDTVPYSASIQPVQRPKDDTTLYSPSIQAVQRPRDGTALHSPYMQPLQRPKDGAPASDRVSLGPGMRRPIDSVLDEPGIRMKEVLPEPKDDLLWRRPDHGSPRPKEVDPSRGRLRVIDPAGRQSEKNNRRRDNQGDGGITWII
ncbi:MAG: cell division protein [Methanomicrobiales archaeon]|nr:cell division protein [Methanomicrobiales archaeon]